MSAFGIKAAALNILTDWKKAYEHQKTSNTNTSTGASIVVRKW